MNYSRILAILFVVSGLLVSCAIRSQPSEIMTSSIGQITQSLYQQTRNPTILLKPSPTSQIQLINSPTPSSVDYYLPDVALSITIPYPYKPVKSTEVGRRGSFVSYDFVSNLTSLPSLREIQFFSENSIREFTSQICEIGPCFEGDFPDLQRFFLQKRWFQTGKGNTYGEPIHLGGTIYLATTLKNRFGVTREYTTFIKDIKIDIWVELDDVGHESTGNALISFIRFNNALQDTE
jgi:hypothetical protein